MIKHVIDIDKLVIEAIRCVAETHDSTEPHCGLWSHVRRDPDAFRSAMRHVVLRHIYGEGSLLNDMVSGVGAIMETRLDSDGQKILCCSFCGKREVKALIAAKRDDSEAVAICDECLVVSFAAMIQSPVKFAGQKEKTVERDAKDSDPERPGGSG